MLNNQCLAKLHRNLASTYLSLSELSHAHDSLERAEKLDKTSSNMFYLQFKLAVLQKDENAGTSVIHWAEQWQVSSVHGWNGSCNYWCTLCLAMYCCLLELSMNTVSRLLLSVESFLDTDVVIVLMETCLQCFNTIISNRMHALDTSCIVFVFVVSEGVCVMLWVWNIKFDWISNSQQLNHWRKLTACLMSPTSNQQATPLASYVLPHNWLLRCVCICYHQFVYLIIKFKTCHWHISRKRKCKKRSS